MECKQNNLEFLVSIARISFLSLAEKINLLKNIDSASSLALLSIDEIGALCGRALRIKKWDGNRNYHESVREAKIIEAKKIGFALYTDALYPSLLREIPDAPFMLFYIGDISILSGKTVSVVGTRHVTPDGRAAAHDFAYDAVNNGVTVVSGLAFGADAAAHSGAVDAYFDSIENAGNKCKSPSGKTAAVLPCGCDTVVPKSNAKLAHNILRSGGCILSEYVPGTETMPWRFVQRNRIIAALSPATVVVQAGNGSGALITAQFALEYNRELMFHAAALSESARKTGEASLRRLQKEFVLGNISRSKLENSPERFLESGAPVIKDYKDFCVCLKEMPGGHSCKIKSDGQLELPVI